MISLNNVTALSLFFSGLAVGILIGSQVDAFQVHYSDRPEVLYKVSRNNVNLTKTRSGYTIIEFTPVGLSQFEGVEITASGTTVARIPLPRP